MLNIYNYEGKTEEEALEIGLQDLSLDIENVYYKTSEKSGSLFKSKKYNVQIVTKEEIKKYIKEYIKDLSKQMNIDINMELKEKDGNFYIQLISDNNSILIGKDGRTINAIQVLLRQSIVNKVKQNIKINVDVANYKNNKVHNLEREIKKIAKEISNSKVDVTLDPMNSYERRIVHTIISEYNDLATESTGEGLERHVVIKYIGE